MKHLKKIMIVVFAIHGAIQIQAQGNDKWIEDYAATKRYMSEAYANLDWAITTRKIDLVALDRLTLDSLKAAKNDAEARTVLNKFLAAFEDGHLKLVEENGAAQGTKIESPPINADTPADKACSSLGYKLRLYRFSLPFEKAPGFKQVSTNKDQFLTAVFTLPNGKKYAVLRIGLFGPDGYFGHCSETWNAFRSSITSNCDQDCIDRFSRIVENKLTEKLTNQIRTLQEEKADSLIVDIGGNGGGTNWVEAVARTLSPKPLPRVRSGFIRHRHWEVILDDDLKSLKQDLLRPDLTAKQRKYLTAVANKLEQLVEATKTPCDRSYVWTTKRPDKPCSGVIEAPDFSSKAHEYFSRDEIKSLKAYSLFLETDREYQPSVVRSGLIVLVDSKTASASENFASWMQYNKAADVVGEKTYGAGRGYVNGGTNYFLPNSKLRLRMPDCVRYRADGVNEVSGIMPDVRIWEREDDKEKRLEKLLVYLTTAKGGN